MWIRKINFYVFLNDKNAMNAEKYNSCQSVVLQIEHVKIIVADNFRKINFFFNNLHEYFHIFKYTINVLAYPIYVYLFEKIMKNRLI